nr:reverse transcriptase domain-containing protein [Tanacetum cinerariifolium]
MDLKTKLETTKNHQASIFNLEAKFNRFVDKESGRPSGSFPSNTKPNPNGSSSKPYQPPQARNEHVNMPDDEDNEPTPQPKPKKPKPVKETPISKTYKPKIPFPQRLRKEKMEAQYEKFLDMIRSVRINIPLVDVLAGMPNYGKFLKELIDVIDGILEENFDALLDEGSKILHSIEGTILEEKLFAKFGEFMAMTIDENSESESDTEEPPFEKIIFNTDYKIKTSLEEPPTDLELKPLHDNLECVFLE